MTTLLIPPLPGQPPAPAPPGPQPNPNPGPPPPCAGSGNPALIDVLYGDIAAAREVFDRLQRRRHDPDREGAGGWPPGPPPRPRPA